MNQATMLKFQWNNYDFKRAVQKYVIPFFIKTSYVLLLITIIWAVIIVAKDRLAADDTTLHLYTICGLVTFVRDIILDILKLVCWIVFYALTSLFIFLVSCFLWILTALFWLVTNILSILLKAILDFFKYLSQFSLGSLASFLEACIGEFLTSVFGLVSFTLASLGSLITYLGSYIWGVLAPVSAFLKYIVSFPLQILMLFTGYLIVFLKFLSYFFWIVLLYISILLFRIISEVFSALVFIKNLIYKVLSEKIWITVIGIITLLIWKFGALRQLHR